MEDEIKNPAAPAAPEGGEEDYTSSLISQLKAQNVSEDDMMDLFYKGFTEGKIDRGQLESLANELGYELTDEFKNDPTPDPIASPAGAEGGEGGITEGDAEAAKQLEPGESADDFKDRVLGGEGEEAPDAEGDDETPADEGDEGDEADDDDSEEDGDDGLKDGDDEEEWKEAQKYFK